MKTTIQIHKPTTSRRVEKTAAEKERELSIAALELFQASATLDMITNSDVMTCSAAGLSIPTVVQLRRAIDFITGSIVKNAKIVHDIVNE